MPVTIRFASDANKNTDVMIERLSDGLFFDFNAGMFSSSPGNSHLPMTMASDKPGRYAATIPHQKLGQFVLNETYCFWVMNYTGLLNPARTAIWVQGVTIHALPWNVNDNLIAVISETATAF